MSLLILAVACTQVEEQKHFESTQPDAQQAVNEQLDADTLQRKDSTVLYPSDTEVIRPDLGQRHDSATPVQLDQFTSIADAEPDISRPTDMAIPHSFECPNEASTSMCLFGETTRVLQDDEGFDITSILTLTRVVETSEEYERYILLGFQCEGIFFPMTLAEALELTDDGIEIRRVVHLASSRTFTWYRFYMGDTEVGFIFDEYGQVSAIIGDQDIHTCQIST